MSTTKDTLKATITPTPECEDWYVPLKGFAITLGEKNSLGFYKVDSDWAQDRIFWIHENDLTFEDNEDNEETKA